MIVHSISPAAPDSGTSAGSGAVVDGGAPDAVAADRALRLAFAPLHKRAFGVAVGLAVGLAIFVVTAARLLAGPEGVTYLSLLSQFLAGYEESWIGALIGLGWGFAVGFVAGWFAAFVRNLVLATYLFLVRTRADLLATRDFLDHI
ncbi:MAG: hypothetical protein ACYC2G_06935 [Gemmatimonadaceae bacterium]